MVMKSTNNIAQFSGLIKERKITAWKYVAVLYNLCSRKLHDVRRTHSTILIHSGEQYILASESYEHFDL
jgi:hypothetical protein